MDANIAAIANKLKKAHSIALFCHTNPDGDTLGSALALAHVLRKRGADADVYCDTPVPKKYLFSLKGADAVMLPDKKTHEISVAVDAADAGRLGDAYRQFASSPVKLAVDHHISHKRFADTEFTDASASATAEIVYDVINEMGLLDDVSAELLFAALVSDNGCFAYSSTTARSHEVAGKLLAYDFDAGKTVYNVFKRTERSVFELKTRVLSKCRFYDDGRIAVLRYTKEDFEATGTDSSDTEGIITQALDVDGVETAISVAEAGDKSYKISIRTKNYADASSIASVFGGGGHKRAAGCRISGYMEDVVDKMLKAARDVM